MQHAGDFERIALRTAPLAQRMQFKLQVRDSGVFLSRRICVNEDARRNLGVEVTRGSAGRIRILSAERMRELERVAADGEVVWPPEEAGVEGEISRLEQMVEQLD